MGKDDTKLKVPKELKFIKHGRLNLLALKEGKNCERVDTDTHAFLSDPRIIKTSSMESVTFQPNCVFKVTLDFREPMVCSFDHQGGRGGGGGGVAAGFGADFMSAAVRESTDWMLMSCIGNQVAYNKMEQRLVLFNATPCVGSVIRELMIHPVNIQLKFTEDGDWIADEVWRD